MLLQEKDLQRVKNIAALVEYRRNVEMEKESKQRQLNYFRSIEGWLPTMSISRERFFEISQEDIDDCIAKIQTCEKEIYEMLYPIVPKKT